MNGGSNTRNSKYFIVLANFIMRIIINTLIKNIGFKTQSETISHIKDSVFFGAFCNTAILLLLVNANFGQIAIPIFEEIFKGKYPDFTPQWYNDIGDVLVGVMIFNIYWPLIEFIFFYAMRVLFRQWDRGFSLSWNKTKK